MVEYPAYNGEVVGSNPITSKINFSLLDFYTFFVESFYEIVFFVVLYVIFAESSMLHLYGLLRVRRLIYCILNERRIRLNTMLSKFILVEHC